MRLRRLQFGSLPSVRCSGRNRAGQAPQAAPGPPIIRSVEVHYTGPEPSARNDSGANAHKGGPTYSNQVVEEDIAALNKTGAIQNVRIFAQPEGDGVKVIVAVQTRAILREIESPEPKGQTPEDTQRNK